VDRLGFDFDFLRTVIAQALGTLLAALVILLVGIAGGVVSDIDLRTWIAILGAFVLTIGTVLVWVRLIDAREAQRAAEAMATIEGMTEEEHVQFSKYFDKGRWNNMDGEEKAEVFRAIRSAIDRHEEGKQDRS
jgi:hypothetical protein